MPVTQLKIRGIQPYDRTNLTILISSLDFHRKNNSRVVLKSDLSNATKGEAILEIILIDFYTVDFVAHTRSVFLNPVFLKIVSVNVSLACDQIANQSNQPRCKARLGKDVHLNLLNDDQLVV